MSKLFEDTDNGKTRIGFGSASMSSIFKTFDLYKAGHLPDPLEPNKLHNLGIPVRDKHIIIDTLQDWGLADNALHPTERFNRLIRVYEVDQEQKAYQDIMKEIKEETYREISADPARATPSQLKEAFEKYKPASEVPKMVSLYRGLCREAGLIPPLEGIPRQSGGKFAPKPKATLEVEEHDNNALGSNTATHIHEERTSGVQKMETSNASASNQSLIDVIIELLRDFRRSIQQSDWTEENRKRLEKRIREALELAYEEQEGGKR
jgi:hypothetical protein